ALWVLFTWLNSRGKFMFLHCVALNKAEVTEPWNKFAQEGNSLFVFRIVLGLIGMIVFLPSLIIATVMIFGMLLHGSFLLGGIMMAIGFGVLFLTAGILLALVKKLTTDFVVPIMFLRGKNCLDAWKEFWGLLTTNITEFLLYVLFQIVLAIVIGLMILLVVLATCCVAGCFMALPYLGTVILLPVFIFKRAYSVHYFAQYGPAYNVFPPTAPPPSPGPIPPPMPG
ncbi:MAG TPA: hypothetical protein VKA67_05235, partial [Verrucomicrobiae bacterium]|nr:hypothetical protein [Verrucomicrobiae bacterium]